LLEVSGVLIILTDPNSIHLGSFKGAFEALEPEQDVKGMLSHVAHIVDSCNRRSDDNSKHSFDD
jgi:hypothetical protein